MVENESAVNHSAMGWAESTGNSQRKGEGWCWKKYVNEEHRQMKIHIKNEQQQHKNLTGGSPKQSTIAERFWLLILKNGFRISYNKKWLKN